MKYYLCDFDGTDFMEVSKVENGRALFQICDKRDNKWNFLTLSMENTKDLIVYLQSIVDEEEKKILEALSGIETKSLIEELQKRKDVYSAKTDYYITTNVKAEEPSTILVIPDKR